MNTSWMLSVAVAAAAFAGPCFARPADCQVVVEGKKIDRQT